MATAAKCERKLPHPAQGHPQKERAHDTSEQRANVGSIRNALDVWLRRHDEKPRKIKTMSRWGSDKDLPPLWNEPGIREFHDKHVN